MPSSILILSQPGDLHAYAVAEALERKGTVPVLWHTAGFPTQTRETVRFEQGRKHVSLRGPELDLADPMFGTIWNRRPSYFLDDSRLHPADREFADLECKGFRKSILSVISPGAFWVNPYGASRRARLKMVQHEAAIDVGLETPDSLYTNDPDAVRAFIRHHGGEIVYKPLEGKAWSNEETAWMSFTSLLTEDRLVTDELLQLTPGIYQERVPKAFELRITMIGRHAFGAKLLSQETSGGRVDWRKAYDELKMEPFETPPDLLARCRALMAQLGLVFGCFDFIVTPDGRSVFLEVNQMGQFLFVEKLCGLPLLDAFSELLIQGRTDFSWNGRQPHVSYSEVEPIARQRLSGAREVHVVKPEDSAWEGQPGARPVASGGTRKLKTG